MTTRKATPATRARTATPVPKPAPGLAALTAAATVAPALPTIRTAASGDNPFIATVREAYGNGTPIQFGTCPH